MEQILQNCGKLDQIGKSNNSVIYRILDKQGKPNGKALKLVMHNEPNVHTKECEHLHNEAAILRQIRHPAIIRNSGEIMANQQIKNSHFCALQLELADTDFFDKIAKMYPEPVEPKFVRNAFIQVMHGLDHLHSDHNIAHNDLKLENIFLFKNKIKIADFGFASQLNKQQSQSSEQQAENWKNRCKTPLAPEILDLISKKSQDKFDEKKGDMFALGVALFQSMFLRTPFFSQEFASREDISFKYFYENRPEKFWENEEIQSTLKYLQQFEDFRRDAFIDLMNKLFEINPNKRLGVKDVMKHPWFKSVNQQSMGNNLSSCTQF